MYWLDEVASWTRGNTRFLYRDIDVRSVGSALLKRMNIKPYAAPGSRRVANVESASSSVFVGADSHVFRCISDSRNRSDDLTEGSGITIGCGLHGVHRSIGNGLGGVYRMFYCVGYALDSGNWVFDCIYDGSYGYIRNPL